MLKGDFKKERNKSGNDRYGEKNSGSINECSSVEETVLHFVTDKKRGLRKEEAARRLTRDGKNEMAAGKKKGFLQAFLEQLNDPLIYVLIAAAAVSFALHEISDSVIIIVVVGMNGIIGVVQEGKAQRALESLQHLTSPKAMVIRDGVRREIPAAELVAGDLVCLETGMRVPADLRLTESYQLKIEESSLTGESLPSEKQADFRASDRLPLGDRKNMAYMSTVVTFGRGEAIVIATGMDTQIGQIAGLIADTQQETTPLQKRLGDLGKVLSVLSLCLCAALFLIAVWQKRNVLRMLMIAISLAVAAVPEGLPAVVTICLALSVTRMVRVNTIVRRLPSVETLGAVSVVCSDKTGTLTQNRMTVEKYYRNGQEYEIPHSGAGKKETGRRLSLDGELQEFLKGLVLCNDAQMSKEERIGDPTELALLDLAARWGMEKTALEQGSPRISELSFDSERKMMTTCHKSEHGKMVCYTKGAPERVLEHCSHVWENGKQVPMTDEGKEKILMEVQKLSGEALRTLAVARREPSGRGSSLQEDNLTFLGMVGMRDPLRPEAAEAVALFQEAGVSTVMITGDHVDTACAIGRQLGIVKDRTQCMTGEEMERLGFDKLKEKLGKVRVFARVSPAQKVEIVRGFQENGRIVAMTGDGVNDAPSLKKADIGIAMGKNGTDVAKQAADMILTDDNFATIEKAMEEGRGVYENIRKSVIFLLSSNLGEIMTMFTAVILGFASPLKSSHILWINLITDSLPALALGVDSNDKRSLMKCKPRDPKESLFARGGLLCTCFYGVLIAGISLTAFWILPVEILRTTGQTITLENLSAVLEQELILRKAQTYAFTVLGMSQLFHAVGMRDVNRSVFLMKHGDNMLMILACILGFALQFAVTEIPFLIEAFGTASLSIKEWGYMAVLAAFPLIAHEVKVIIT